MGDAAAAFPAATLPWIDLSTGINPHAWSGPRADFAALRRLPDPAETASLEAAAAQAFGVADPACVVATPGAEFGLRLLPKLTGAPSVAIVSPTYGGHAEAWANAGCAIRPIAWGDDAEDAAALVIVNPNNPDGRAVPAEAVKRLATPSQWLIVDESFVEAMPGLSVAAAAGKRMIVLRSFGKFYGLAGVRLGFLVAAPALATKARQMLGDWPVSAEAIAAGRSAYADPAWAEATRARLQADAARLDTLLSNAGMLVLGGTPLFRLCGSSGAETWFRRLAGHGILVRPFEAQPDWLRFGLPGNEAEWNRLEEALHG